MTHLDSLKIRRVRLIAMLRRTDDPQAQHWLKVAVDELEETMYDEPRLAENQPHSA